MVPTTPPHEDQQSLPIFPIKGPANEPSGDPQPLMVWGELTLFAWQVSGNPWRMKEFQRKQSILSVCPTLRLGDCGKAGAVRAASLSDIANFLSSEFENGKQYSTLNTYRSAISATHPPIEGYPVGQHLIVCRLLQGMFNERLPQPKVPVHLGCRGRCRVPEINGTPNKALSYKDLTMNW